MLPSLLTVLTAVCTIVTLLFIKFILFLRTLPPGPFPLPIIGSMYALTSDWSYEKQFASWSKKYGDILTVWLGTTPVIVVNGWKLLHEATLVKKNDFSERYQTISQKVLLGKRRGIVGDNGEGYDALRRSAIIVIRKYHGSEKMPDNVLWGIEKALKEELVLDTPLDPSRLMISIMHHVNFAALFGKRDDENDQDLRKMMTIPLMIRDALVKTLWSDYVPLYRNLFCRKINQKFENAVDSFIELLKNNLRKHEQTFQPDDIRNFTDSLIASKEQYIEEMKSYSAYFNEDNMAQILMEFFEGGSDTTAVSLIWIAKVLAHFQEVQSRVYQEIMTYVGDRQLIAEDKDKCHYTQAVIMEIFRLYTPVTTAFMRQAAVDTELGGYKIPKGRVLIINYCSTSTDHELWPEPELFRPERFLDTNSGEILKKQFPGYLPFGTGKRVCIGERLGFTHLFLITAELVRRFHISSPDSDGKALDLRTQPAQVVNIPHPFKLIFSNR